jgi:rhodanese-related sulfurtransferase
MKRSSGSLIAAFAARWRTPERRAAALIDGKPPGRAGAPPRSRFVRAKQSAARERRRSRESSRAGASSPYRRALAQRRIAAAEVFEGRFTWATSLETCSSGAWIRRARTAIRISARTDARVALICSEGYQSSLAAGTVARFGLAEVTDVVRGFQAWRAAGLPVDPPAGRRLRLGWLGLGPGRSTDHRPSDVQMAERPAAWA